MELALYVYLASVVSNVSALFFILSLSSTLAFIFYVISQDVDRKPIIKKYILVPIICAFLAAITPSEKTMYMMLAAYTGQQVLESDTASKVKKLVDSKLDEYLLEVENKAKK